MKLYVVRMDWDDDFVEVCQSLKDVAELILDFMIAEEDCAFDKDKLLLEMEKREEENWEDLIGHFFDNDDCCYLYGWKVQAREL